MLQSLPEGFGLPETKHLNILSNARQFVLGFKVQMMFVCICKKSLDVMLLRLQCYHFLTGPLFALGFTSQIPQNILILQFT